MPWAQDVIVSGRRLRRCRNLLWFTAIACLSAAVLLYVSQALRHDDSQALIQPVGIQPQPATLHYPDYEMFLVENDTTFRYTPIQDQPYTFAPPTQAEAAPLPAGPDVSGLRLVATLPGTAKAFAILESTGVRGQMLVPLGGMVGDSFVSAIGAGFIELTRDGIKATLQLFSPWTKSGELAAQTTPSPSRAATRRTDRPLAERTVITPSSVKDRRHMGITVRSLTEVERTAAGLSPGQGVLVTGVERNDADVKEGDVLTSMEDAPIFSIAMIIDALRDMTKRSLRFSLLRAGNRHETTILLYE
jgi:hypothetical protein